MRKANIHTNISAANLEVLGEGNNVSMFRTGALFSDAITFGAEKIDKKLLEEFSKMKGKKTLPFKGQESDLTEYLDLYHDLAPK